MNHADVSRASRSPDQARSPEAAAGFAAQLGLRLRAHAWLKAIGTSVFMTVFFIGYFHLLEAPVHPVTVMPVTTFDRWLPFQPWTLPIYLSLWIYVSLAPALFTDRRELLAYGAVAAGMALVGFAVFYFFPTVLAPPQIDWERHPAFAALKEVDRTGNACPSLHVAFAVFSARWFQRLLESAGDRRRWRVASWVWCVAIAYSTLATRQHVIVDVAAGALLGWAGGGIPLRPVIGALIKVRIVAAE